MQRIRAEEEVLKRRAQEVRACATRLRSLSAHSVGSKGRTAGLRVREAELELGSSTARALGEALCLFVVMVVGGGTGHMGLQGPLCHLRARDRTV